MVVVGVRIALSLRQIRGRTLSGTMKTHMANAQSRMVAVRVNKDTRRVPAAAMMRTPTVEAKLNLDTQQIITLLAVTKALTGAARRMRVSIVLF